MNCKRLNVFMHALMLHLSVLKLKIIVQGPLVYKKMKNVLHHIILQILIIFRINPRLHNAIPYYKC